MLVRQCDIVVATVVLAWGSTTRTSASSCHAEVGRTYQQAGRARRDESEAEASLFHPPATSPCGRTCGGARQGRIDRDLKHADRQAEDNTWPRRKVGIERWSIRPGVQVDGCGACDICLGEANSRPRRWSLEDPFVHWHAFGRTVVSGTSPTFFMGSNERVARLGHDREHLRAIAGDRERQVKDWIGRLVGGFSDR